MAASHVCSASQAPRRVRTASPNQGQFAGFKIKGKRGVLVWSMIYSWSQENPSPLKWYFFLGSNPSIFLRPGNISFSPPCIFQRFPLLHDTPFTSIYSAGISAGLLLLRELCRSTTQNWCFVSPKELGTSLFWAPTPVPNPQEGAASRAVGSSGTCRR